MTATPDERRAPATRHHVTTGVSPTVSPREAGAGIWDAIIIGAGPAGAAAAIGLARGRHRVLLLDKQSFPRWKVCGCCLSPCAERALAQLGLGSLAAQLGAPVLHTLDLATPRAHARIPLQGGHALSRERLDAHLLQEAIRSGAGFLDRASVAHISRDRRSGTVTLRSLPEGGGAAVLRAGGGYEPSTLSYSASSLPRRTCSDGVTLRARLVLLSDGLASLQTPELGTLRTRTTRIGLGATIPSADPPRAAAARGLLGTPGVISMTLSRHGYLGAVLLEDGSLNLAAAVAPDFLRRHSSPNTVLAAVLGAAKRPIPDSLSEARFKGTPALTRRRARVAAPGLLALGDSAAYVEPFSGEGIAWSLTSGIAAARNAHDILEGRATHLAWQHWFDANIRPQHRRCAVLALALRTGPLADLAIRSLSLAPRWSAALAELFTSPSPA
jgi:flavin-dependent dehydrogenase